MYTNILKVNTKKMRRRLRKKESKKKWNRYRETGIKGARNEQGKVKTVLPYLLDTLDNKEGEIREKQTG